MSRKQHNGIGKAQVNLLDEIIVDNFAGGGGASTGIELATGRTVEIAINHDPDAILMHKTNHPYTRHFQASVWDIDPHEVCHGRPVGLAWFSPDCFPKGTLILTNNGYMPIEDVRIGDMVLTHKLRWRRVTDTMATTRDEAVVTGYGHPGLVCSTGHPFYVRERSELWNEPKNGYEHIYSAPIWKKAKDLTKKDYWGCPASVEPLPIPQLEKPNKKTLVLPVDERLLWLAGRYTGDGWTRLTDKRGEVVIVCGEHEVDHLREKLNSWPRAGKRARDGELAWSFRRVRTGGQFTCNSRSLVTWLRENFGHLAGEKKIPPWLMGAAETLRTAFLEGYIGADGCMTGKLVETSTVSKKLAYGLKTLVATTGGSPCVYHQKGNSDKIEGRDVNAKSIYKVRWRLGIDEKHRQTFNEDGFLWAPIKSSEATGRQGRFFNISVEEDESYVVEGVIVHNCKHFSKAKGGKPVDKNIRGLAWITLRWAGTVMPRVIILENVEEFQTWGPVRRGKPVKSKSGQTFMKFIAQLRDLGYEVEWRELVAADFGAPTTRKRFFLVARCDGKPIVWPAPTHAPRDSEEVKTGRLLPWVSAAEIIDWSLPCPSIFDTKAQIKEKYGITAVRPLADKTMRRAIRGVDQFTIKSNEPFLLMVNHGEDGRNRTLPALAPLPTVTATHGLGIADPVLAPVQVSNTDNSVGTPADMPVHTVTTAGNQMLVCTALTAIGQTGCGDRVRDIREPTHTAVSKAEDCLLGASLIQYHTEQTERVRGQTIRGPIMTIDAANRYGLVGASLMKYYGNDDHGQGAKEPLHTITAKDREGVLSANLSIFHGASVGTAMQGLAPATLQKDHEAVEAAFLSKFFGGVVGVPVTEPTPTVTVVDHNALTTASLMKLKGQEIGSAIHRPLPTVTAEGKHHAIVATTVVPAAAGANLGHWPEVRGLLNKYCGYDLKDDELLLLQINGIWWFIKDIGLRMLTPRELYAANGFPPDYIIDHDYQGNVYGKTKQVARCGNAVPPPFATALVRANLPEWCDKRITTMEELEREVAV